MLRREQSEKSCLTAVEADIIQTARSNVALYPLFTYRYVLAFSDKLTTLDWTNYALTSHLTCPETMFNYFNAKEVNLPIEFP